MKSEEETSGNQVNPETEFLKNSNPADGSPRCVLEIPILGVDSDNSSSSSVSSNGSGSGCNESSVSESNGLQWRNFMSVLRKKSIKRLSTFPLPGSELSRRNLSRKLAQIRNGEDGVEGGGEAVVPKPSWRSFDYEELVTATDNFSSEKLIGKGGHAEVYKGCLPDGQLVAVKRLTKRKTEDEIIADFLTELGIIAHIDHPNVARLIGFGVDGGLHLVLRFSSHGSLASMLHGSKDGLDWAIRFKVAVGVAEGLLYLHQGCRRRVIHRDIKASNILLTDDYEPQISDFGLAKWLPNQWSHHIVFPIEGTFGYLAPEYFMHGIVDEKTDVFAFGVLLLELITGRRAVDASRQSLVMWVRFADAPVAVYGDISNTHAKPLLDANKAQELVDPCLGDAHDPVEMRRAMSVASMCIHHLSSMRPHMNQVVKLLIGENGRGEVKGREHRPNVLKSFLFDACDLDDYTCSRYLSDLNRHRKLALE